MSRVLVVEDSASTRAFVRATLEDEAFAASVGGCEVAEDWEVLEGRPSSR